VVSAWHRSPIKDHVIESSSHSDGNLFRAVPHDEVEDDRPETDFSAQAMQRLRQPFQAPADAADEPAPPPQPPRH
jgi:hypothetical protein